MKCTQCGHDNQGDARFCGGCGASLSQTTSNGPSVGSVALPMVNFAEAVELGCQRYSDFGGRSTRAVGFSPIER